MARRKQASEAKTASHRSTASIFHNIESHEKLEENDPEEVQEQQVEASDDVEEAKFPFSLLYEFQDLLNLHLNFRKGVELLTCLYFLQITYLYLKDDIATLLAIGFSVFGSLLAMYLTHRSLCKKHVENPEKFAYPKLPEFNTIYAFIIPILFMVLLGETTSPYFQMNLALNTFCVRSMSPIPKILSSAVFYYMYNENEMLDFFEFARVVWLYFCIQWVLSWWNEHRENESDAPLTTLTESEIHIFSVFAVNLLCNFNVEVTDTNIVLHIVRTLLLALIIAFAVSYPVYYLLQYVPSGFVAEFVSVAVMGVFSAAFYYATNFVFTRQVVDQEVISWLLDFINSSELRVQLLTYWVAALAVAIPVLFVFTSKKLISLNSGRKLWHLMLAGAIAYPALVDEPVFTAIAVSGSVFVFVVLEAVRCTRLGFLGRFLSSLLTHFQDEKDTKGPLNLSYIFLLVGVACPIVYGAAVGDIVSIRSYIGVITLGLSDTMASFIGGHFGKYNWKGGNRTLEGTIAHSVATFSSFVLVERFLLPGTEVNWENLFVVTLAGSVLEGAATLNDNFLVPVMSLIMYEMLKKTFQG